MSQILSFSFPEGDIRGDMFYIKHGTRNFTVIDCYLKDGNGPNARKNEIIKKIIEESKGRVCRFISTHPDNDHIAGIESLNEKWPITNFYAVANDRPNDENDNSLLCYKQLVKNHNYPISRGISRKWLNDSNNENGSSGINFHWPNTSNKQFMDACQKVREGQEINNICPIFTYNIEDGATYMWMGDLETKMQQSYYNENKYNIPHVDILFQPHHGRKSGSVPEELLNALNPQLIIIGNAPSEHIDYGDSRQTITQNTAGDILFENEKNEVHIYTKNKINNTPTCLKKKRGKRDLRKQLSFDIDWYYGGTLTINK